ncbi:hypothetical protein L6452_23031 [Arctium lappa]|uniref:Uncharacterized protein n=1 Tax=Arctium lappa TaxID=4217 RepID=A0ACB9B0G6_ARCLA|nr:hypothetical protein L6452_23031 [Arctium lappa]
MLNTLLSLLASHGITLPQFPTTNKKSERQESLRKGLRSSLPMPPQQSTKLTGTSSQQSSGSRQELSGAIPSSHINLQESDNTFPTTNKKSERQESLRKGLRSSLPMPPQQSTKLTGTSSQQSSGSRQELSGAIPSSHINLQESDNTSDNLEEKELDDLYNDLRVFEAEVESKKKPSGYIHNAALLSASTDTTANPEAVSTAVE